MTGERYEQTCSQPSTDSYKIPTQLILKYYLKKLSQNFHPHPQKSATKSFSRHSKRFVPGRPWTPLYLNIFLKNVLQIFTPPPPPKVLQNHFQVILSDLSLDAPVRPCTPLCQNAFCLTSPGAGACHPPPIYSRGSPLTT